MGLCALEERMSSPHLAWRGPLAMLLPVRSDSRGARLAVAPSEGSYTDTDGHVCRMI